MNKTKTLSSWSFCSSKRRRYTLLGGLARVEFIEKLAFEQKPGDEKVGHGDIQGKAKFLRQEHSCGEAETTQGQKGLE